MRRLLSLLFLLVVLPCHAEIRLRVAVDALHESVAKRIVAAQYDSVLAAADKYLRTQERLSDGRWKLAILYGGLDIGFVRAASTDAAWDARAAALQSLVRRHPGSPNAWLFLAQLEQSRAWAARGEDSAAEVGDARFRVFRIHVSKEIALLEEHRVLTNPVWHELHLQAAADAGASQTSLDQLFAAAIEREPGYQSTWYTRLNYSQAKWGGSFGRMIALVNQGAGMTSPTEGRGMMARMLEIASELGEPDLTEAPGIDWKTVKASFGDVLERYPDDWNAQWYFYQACRHSDKAEALHLLAFVKEAPSPALLKSNVPLFTLCTEWVTGKIPGFLMRNTAKGTEKLIQ